MRRNSSISACLDVWLHVTHSAAASPLMTKPKLFPSLCKQMSIVLDITPEVLSGAWRRGREDIGPLWLLVSSQHTLMDLEPVFITLHFAQLLNHNKAIQGVSVLYL